MILDTLLTLLAIAGACVSSYIVGRIDGSTSAYRRLEMGRRILDGHRRAMSGRRWR